MTQRKGDGSRKVDLLIPFEDATGQRVETISFRPFLYGDFVRLTKGAFTGINDVICDVAGIEMHTLEALRYPDADTVLQEFLMHVPPSVRDSLVAGDFPKREASDEPPSSPDPQPDGDEWGPQAPSDLGPLDEPPDDFGGPGMDIGDGRE